MVSHRTHVVLAQRLLAIGCIPVLMALMLWSALSGTVALIVTLWRFGRIGVPVADSWASARARGQSGTGAAGDARWPMSFAVLAWAVAPALATAPIAAVPIVAAGVIGWRTTRA